jgi:hypothetical protein
MKRLETVPLSRETVPLSRESGSIAGEMSGADFPDADPTALYQLGIRRLEEGDRRGALEQYERLLPLDPPRAARLGERLYPSFSDG